MKNKKVKTISILLIGFLCVLIGSPFIKGTTTTRTLAPNEYWGLGITLNVGDTLNFRIESSIVSINIYIMNQEQIDFYRDNPQDEASWYTGREYWHYLLLTSSFVAPSDQMYYVLMINPSDSTSTYVVIDASVDEYIPKTLTIINPTSASTFSSGYNYITWTSTGDINYVQIYLYKNWAFLETIDGYTYNDGSYSWYIYEDEYTDGSYYQIYIRDYFDTSIYDYTGYFTIKCELETEKTITITNPIRISIFSSGYNYITWISTGSIEAVKIELYKNGILFETIDSGTYNVGSYTWNINIDDYEDGFYYQIKISDCDDSSIYDWSESFTITDKIVWIGILPIFILIGIVITLSIVLPIVFVRRKKKREKELEEHLT